MAVDRKVAVSGVMALPGVASIALWLVSIRFPSLLSRDDLIPVYVVVVSLSVVSLLGASVWRWWTGDSWHADVALLVSLAAQGFNCCCGVLPSIVKVTPSNW